MPVVCIADLRGIRSVDELDFTLPDPPEPEELPVESVLEGSVAPSSSLSPVDAENGEPEKEVAMDVDEAVRKEKEAADAGDAPPPGQEEDVVEMEVDEPSKGSVPAQSPPKQPAHLPPHLRMPPPMPRSQSFSSPTINPSALLQGPAKAATNPAQTHSALRLHQQRHEYAHHLPPVPQHLVTSRLAVAQPRTARVIKQHRKDMNRGRSPGVGGVWGGSGYTQTLKALLHGQHAGVKLALGKVEDATGRAKLQKQRVGNVLVTDDWNVSPEGAELTASMN